MNKMRYFLLLCCCLPGLVISAQNPTLNINSGNFTGEVSVTDNSFTSNSCLLALGASIRVVANADFTPTLTPSVLSKVKLLVTAIGPNVSLGGSATEQPLGTAPAQTLYSALVSLGGGGAVAIRYRMLQSDMNNIAWKAGTYSTGLTFTTPGGALCLGTTTYPATLSIIVAPFISFTAPADLTLTVDDLNYFRTSTLSGSHTLPFAYTVPLGLHVKTSATNFVYTNGYSGAPNPNTLTGNVSAAVTAPTAGTAIALNSAYLNLSPLGGFPIPTTNKQTNTVTYSITPANLKSGFLQMGTYATTLNYEAFDAGTPAQAAAVQQNPLLTINVQDLGQLQVNNADVTLPFASTSDYTNGVSASQINALTISKTTPYDVYVKASGPYLTGKTNNLTIPVSCISIASSTGDPSVTPVTLSSTAQKIISAAPPAIDRQVGLKYSIAPDKTALILGNPADDYVTAITYSFVPI
ncbi:MAG: hypothetical protein J7539_15620 [Niabella sp.]|nr:hypothetical protein [Niabella sp.]